MKRILSTRLNVALLVGLVGLLGLSFAAIPPAGTQIGNVATATYTANGETQTVTSNTVYVVVQPVHGVKIETDGTRTGVAGSQVAFPHTITNTGNVTDSYNLTFDAVTTGLSNYLIYLDADGDGVPDNNVSITSVGPLAPGQSIGIVIVAVVPTSGTGPWTFNVVATSLADSAITDNNTDTINLTTGAAIQATKGVSPNSGPKGTDTVTYTIRYTNNGNAPATALVFADTLNANLTYKPGTALWSGNSTTALTEDGTDNNGITFTISGQTLTFTVADVAVGESGIIEFQAAVSNTAPVGPIPNVATFTYNGPSSVSGTTNTAIFTVTASSSLTFTGQTLPDAPAGSLVKFANTLVNTGNATDTFNVVVNTLGSNFPTGSTYTLVSSDNATPLLDTNGDGIPDTGPVAAGASYIVHLWVQLPAGVAGGGAYTVTKTATSVSNPGVSATATDILTTISTEAVDLTNVAAVGDAGALGTGSGIGQGAVQTKPALPGETVTFDLYVNNTSTAGPAQTYTVTAWANEAGTVALPEGVTVTFAPGATTSALAVDANEHIVASVTLGADVPAGTVSVYFRAVSTTKPTVFDVKRDDVAVGTTTNRSVTINPDLIGQVSPGGTITYKHVVANNGPVSEGGTFSNIVLTVGNSSTNFSTVLYYDTNNNGVLDAADDVYTPGAALNATLAPGQSVIIFAVVYASPSTPVGATNATTITATTSQGTHDAAVYPAPPVDTAVDITTVIPGDLVVTKRQSLDNATWTTGNLNVLPGATVYYQITVRNRGTLAATNVVIKDNVPAHTTYVVDSAEYSVAGGPATAITGVTTQVATPTPGFTLAPTQTATLTFAVKVNN